MNKIFKVIWNHATQSFVVVSELTKSKGKTSSKTDKRVAAGLATTLGSALLALSVAPPATAVVVTISGFRAADGSAYWMSGNADASELGIAIGNNTQAYAANSSEVNKSLSYTNSIALGNNVSAASANVDSDGKAVGTIAIGTGINASSPTSTGSIAIGSCVTVNSQWSVVMGKESEAKWGTAQSVVIGTFAQALGKNEGVNDGLNGVGSVAVGTKAIANGSGSAAIGQDAQTKGQNSVAIGYASRTRSDRATAVGSGAEANGQYSSAFGRQAIANGTSAAAIANGARALGNLSVAIGDSANASGASAIAMGNQSKSSADSSIAIGRNANATANDTVALGTNSLATQIGASALTANSKALGNYAIAAGNDANASAEHSIAMGYGSNVTNGFGIAMGYDSKVSGKHGIALGHTSNASGSTSLSLGMYSNSNGSDSIALGTNATTTSAGQRGVAIGQGANASKADSVALGSYSTTTATASNQTSATVNGYTYSGFVGTVASQGHYVSVGNSTENSRQIKYVAAGEISASSTDAINGSQLYLVADRIEKGWNITSAANGGTTSGTQEVKAVKPTDTVKLQSGKNIDVNQNGTNFTFATADNVTFSNIVANNSITVGGVNISTSGIDAGGNKITNVTNGTLNSTSTDAVNGSQLYQTNQNVTNVSNNLTNLTNLVDGGLNFMGDTGTVSNRKLNTTLNVIGGITDTSKLTDNNLGVVSDGNGTLTVKLAKDLNLTNNGSITIGNVSINNGGINAGNTTITNVGPGVNGTDAVNLNQLNASTANTTLTVANGKITQPDATEGNKLVNATTVANAVNNVSWKLQENSSDRDDVKAGDTVNFVNTSTANINITTTNGNVSVVKVDVNTTAVRNNLTGDATTNSNGTATTTTGDQFLNATTITNLVNNSSFNATIGSDKTNFTDQSGISNYTVKAGETLKFQSGKNLRVKQENGTFTYATEENVTFSNIVANNSITVGGVNISTSGINAGNTTITNVANGVNGTDAVNLNQLNASTANTTLTVANGKITQPDATEGNKLVNATTVANAVNNVSWKLQENGVDKDDVKAGDTVNFANSSTASINITTTNGNVSVVKVDVNTTAVRNNLTGDATTNSNGTATTTTGDQFLNATTITNLVNNSSFNATIGSDKTDFTDQAGIGNYTVKAGETLKFQSGKNLRVKQENGTFTYATEENVTFSNIVANNSITVGGVNISTSGINAGNTTITNVANGVNGTDAVNLNQLNASTANTTLTVENGKITQPDATEGNKLVNATTVANAVNNVSWKLQENGVDKDDVKAGDIVNFANSSTASINITTTNGNVSVVTVDVNTTAVRENLTGNANTTADGKANVIGDGDKFLNATTITNLVNNSSFNATIGSDKTDFEDQAGIGNYTVKAGETLKFQSGKNLRVKQENGTFTYATEENVTFNNIVANNSITVGNISITKDGIDAGNNTISNVSNGTISADSKDAVNGSQLYQTNQNVSNLSNNLTNLTNLVDGGLNFMGDTGTVSNRKLNTTLNVVGGVTDTTKLTDNNLGVVSDGNGTLTVKLSKDLNLTSNGSITIGDTKIQNGDISVGNISITKGGINAGNTTITNVAPGVNGTDAVNVNQLNNVTNLIVNATATTNLTVSDGVIAPPAEGSKLVNATTVADAINNVYWKLGDDKDATNTPVANISAGSRVDFISGNYTTANVKSTGNGANVSYDVNIDAVKNELTGNGNNTTDGKANVIGDGSKFLNATTVTNIINNTSFNATIGSDTSDFDDQSGKANSQVKPGETLTLQSGKNLKVKQSGNTFTYALSDNIDLGKNGSVTIGNTTVSDNGVVINNGPSITQTGIDAGSKTITNVAPGTNGTDAVNVNQLNQVANNINNNTNAINKLGDQMNKMNKDLRAGIAGATAMSFIQRPHEAGKSMVSVGVGGYKGESAVAVGYGRNSDNNKVSIKVGVGVNSRSDLNWGGSIGYQW